ncbi:flagellar hook protein FlgE [Breoghania sp. L-A4]|uniref:flagellar hook protein FlgE n=1 Tax=Breoghania sp. L-A4 TaxID=2304600 RepID=UPI000E359E75|nr:flagellar hook protein FlgE [Breoghania sp. L-A4]AXS41583.1 flagellar hook protein FlgE [Breoghania sp. L-A4]
MSLTGALNSAVSSLYAQSQALATVADNLANSGTTAYKANSTSFESLVASASSSGSSGGVSATTRANNTAQGLLVSSSSDTSLAIDGSGYFVVSSDIDGSDANYTRNGEFSVDSDGYLVNNGNYLLGWETDADGNVIGGTSETSLVAIDTDAIQSSVGATTEIDIQANLPADAEIGSTYETTLEVYDSLGSGSTVTATWEKTAENTWELSLADPVLSSTGVASGTTSSDPIEITFNSDGTLASTNPAAAELTISGWTTGAAASTISLSLGTTGKTDGLTQYASDSSTPSITGQTVTQNGIAYGNLTGIEISDNGSVIANFDNGEAQTIYKIPIATFANANGLTEMSNGVYARSTTSGSSVLQFAGAGGAGEINGGWLESSTTDTSNEFSSMLAAQQAYSASSQIMSTASDMFDTLINSVR